MELSQAAREVETELAGQAAQRATTPAPATVEDDIAAALRQAGKYSNYPHISILPTSVLDKLDQLAWSDALLTKFNDDLAIEKYGLGDIFAKSPEDLAIWKELTDNPYSKVDFMDETTDPKWLSWKDREFYKAIRAKGKAFEAVVNPRIKSDLQALGVNLTNATQIDQLYVLGPNGNMVIMDNAFVQEVKDLDGTLDYIKVAYNDSKYSNAAGWTDNQKSEIITIFKNDTNKQFIELKVRTENRFLNNTPISQNSTIRLYRQDVFKTISDGSGNFGQTIRMNDINFRD